MTKASSRLSGMRLLSTVINKDAHWKIKILNRWPAIAGIFADHLTVAQIEESTLFLDADHPMWAQEAQGNSETLLEAIAQACGPGRITKIVVRGCKTSRTQRSPDSGKGVAVQRTLFQVSHEAPSIELTSAERDALAAVRHRKLSSSMAEFYQQCKRRSVLARDIREHRGDAHGSCRNVGCTCPRHRPLCSTSTTSSRSTDRTDRNPKTTPSPDKASKKGS